PDGKRLVAVTDEGGEESLIVFHADRTGKDTHLRADLGRPDQLLPAPAGPERVAVTNQRQEVMVVDLVRGT
ncbi:MAG: hypothetical protein GWO24_23930, partial [Akkermansiaceae bacterium]|nr:hypothetical protein [Akkermansiaceae bacterium]